MTALLAFTCGGLCAALIVGCLLLAAHERAGAWDWEQIRDVDREFDALWIELEMD